MKRSRSIGLFVLGTAALVAGCGQRQPDLLQNQYASKADCEKDWGEPQACTSSTHSSGGYVGPRYYWNRSGGGMPMAVMPDGTERAMTNSALARGVPSTAKSVVSHGSSSYSSGSKGSSTSSVSRGGFGSSAHASSGGG